MHKDAQPPHPTPPDERNGPEQTARRPLQQPKAHRRHTSKKQRKASPQSLTEWPQMGLRGMRCSEVSGKELMATGKVKGRGGSGLRIVLHFEAASKMLPL
uniref:Uncharacterized protein n=1 Tax=Eutreptiella gymnastica TaxID=73025 RepID=A0A7S4CDL7_9EUGL